MTPTARGLLRTPMPLDVPATPVVTTTTLSGTQPYLDLAQNQAAISMSLIPDQLLHCSTAPLNY